jgi:protein-tyrosine sulfotransferase
MLNRIRTVISGWPTSLAYRRTLARLERLLRKEGRSGNKDLRLFILSSGRSGSTLLRRMLQNHPLIHIPPESEDLIPRTSSICVEHDNGHSSDRARKYSDLVASMSCMGHWALDPVVLREELMATFSSGSPNHDLHSVAHRAHARTHKPTATILGDKTPLLIWYTDLLRLLYPKALFICLVRHPLDVSTSIAKMKVHDTDALHAVDRWLGAARVIRKLQGGVHADRTVTVRYEDMVREPGPVIERICTALGITATEGMIEHIPTDLGDTVLAHHSAVGRPVNTTAIGAWKERMDPTEADRLWQRCAAVARSFAYDR